MNAIKDDERLKLQKTAIYQEDVERIEKTLQLFLRRAQAKCVMLIDVDGYLIAKQGNLKDLQQKDMDPLCTLLAGTFMATKAWAKLLGVSEFSEMHHQGGGIGILVKLVAAQALITVIFDDSAGLGLVKLMSKELGKKLQQIFDEADKREPQPFMESFSPEVFDTDNIQQTLDNLFG